MEKQPKRQKCFQIIHIDLFLIKYISLYYEKNIIKLGI